jgi:hypothetical protein
MFCEWCRESKQKNIFVDGGCGWIKESLTRHQKTRSHQKAAKGKSIDQTDLLSSFSIQFGEDKAKIICQMRSVYFLAKHHLALEKYSDLCHLVDYSHVNYNCIVLDSQPLALEPPSLEFSNMPPMSSSNYATYTNPKAACEILASLA